MGSLTQSGITTASQKRCFDFIADPEKAPLFIDNLISISPIDVEPRGVGNTWEWTYEMKDVTFEGVSECTEYVENEKYVWESKTGFPSVWTYTFEPEGDQTKITVEISYTPPESILGKLSESVIDDMNKKAAVSGMENLTALLNEDEE